eukprot:10023603-Prorocentrum_lima.AAC.1
MTSSLVGSEMCIRDRAVAVAGGCPPRVPKAALVMASYVARIRGLEATVSYTHLTLPTICSV